MIRLAWRQFRTEAGIAIAVLVVVAVVLGVTGPHLMSVYRNAPTELASTDHTLQGLLPALLLVAPVLIGIFFGAPLVARELETGTYRLAWTQSVMRLRWLVVKLVLVGLASDAIAGALSLMVAWWANPIDIMNANRFTPSNFDIFGIVPFAYALFVFALGATTGLLFKKTLPAMATTLVGFVAARMVVTYWIRAHFEAPVQIVRAFNAGSGLGFQDTAAGLSVAAIPPTIPNAWPLSAELVDKAGRMPTSAFLTSACPGLAGPSSPGGAVGTVGRRHAVPAPGNMQTCLTKIAEKFHVVVTYQPASRYWPFQIDETALFVVLALALAALGVWLVRRRLA